MRIAVISTTLESRLDSHHTEYSCTSSLAIRRDPGQTVLEGDASNELGKLEGSRGAPVYTTSPHSTGSFEQASRNTAVSRESRRIGVR